MSEKKRSQKTVLLSGVGRNWPVVEALCSRGTENIVLFWSAVDDVIRERGYHVRFFSEFFDQQATSSAKEVLEKNSNSWFWALEHDEVKETIRLLGRDCSSSVGQILKRTIVDEFPKALATIEALRSLKARTGLDLVLLRNDVQPFTRALCLAAQQEHVPVLHLTHSVTDEANIHAQVTASHVAVFGPRCRDWYVTHGCDPGRISVTGNPDWDRYHTGLPVNETRRRLGIVEGVQVVTLAASWYSQHTCLREDVQNLTAKVLGAVSTLQRSMDIHLIIKMHPNLEAKPEWYSNRAVEFGLKRFSVVEHDLTAAIYASDLVISFSSNAGIEAILGGRPVIVMEKGIFNERDAVLFSINGEGLDRLMRAALLDRDVQEELASRRPYTCYRFNYLNDGNAALRVVSVVDSLLHQHALNRQPEVYLS
jgi:hypothetical protein